jgi:predicted enzyme related to lactoylglutathione lyase
MANKFCHIELTTVDPAAAKEFYGSLFDWKLEDMPMGDSTYTMISTGEEPGGGIMAPPMPEVPTAWMTYVEVVDVAASVARAKELGGAVHVDKTPIPDMGFFAVIADPTGGVIGIFESVKKD